MTTNDDLVYLPHATVLMSKGKPNFDMLVPLLRTYFNFMIFPGLCGIASPHGNLCNILSKVEALVDQHSQCLYIPKER